MANLVDKCSWDNINETYELKLPPKENAIRRWIEKYFKNLDTSNKNVLEIGCFPGKFLSVFGELGYELNGIDITPRVYKDLPLWLKKKNYKTGDFALVDFFNYDETRKFDIVCSFGFIEHFTNWKDVLLKQASLVNDNGYLVVSTPNYRGNIQRIFHLIFNRETFESHYIPSMNPDAWKSLLKEANFNVIFCGSIGSFGLLFDNDSRRNFFQAMLLKLVWKISPALQKLPGNNAYSPFCGLIAKKINS